MSNHPCNTSPREELVPGEVVRVKGLDLDRQGLGLARWQGWILVIPNLLPGEIADVQLQQRHRSQWNGRLIETIKQSPSRRKPRCGIAAECGGCSLQHLKDHEQKVFKHSQLRETLLRIGGISHPIHPFIFSIDESFGYRNRGLIPLRRLSNGNLQMGYYKRGSHRIINLTECPVLDQRLNDCLEAIKIDLGYSNWPADSDLLSGDGLRHIGLRIGNSTGEILITLISSTDSLSGLKQQAKRWLDRWDSVKGVTLNLQPSRTNVILGSKTIVLAGEPSINEIFCGLNLKISTTTFFQVNAVQAEEVVKLICDWFAMKCAAKSVVDAYCGIGTISLPIAACGLQVLGLEINSDSIKQANLNASSNCIGNVCFISGDVAEHLAMALPDYDGLIVDPPRKGLNDDVVSAIVENPPKNMAYLSCDPATLARDLKKLVGPIGPYTIAAIQPIDFFPQTTHIECLVFMTLVKP